MFYSYELLKKEGYSNPWQFIDHYKQTFPDLYSGCKVNHEGVEIRMKDPSTTKTKEEKEKIIKTKIFDQNGCEQDLADFLNEKKITRDRIISISMSSDSDAPRRLGKYGIDRILLVWEEER